ncbi:MULTISPECIES: DUF882 domain-containing protein [Ferrimonas]|uniref:DUF882 domain-containing protein n=1 Tax=Ferrimonas TaxID=44011 RepID=UPI000401B348|nr:MULTISPECIES: DUF882 domain-containing protein [Ferrimonas]USD38839.1 DUF882 domain-containing protein [Ferrimonas sp. SCSIO 43195]
MTHCDLLRRRLMLGLGASAVLCQLPQVALASRSTPKSLSFYNRHTGETSNHTFWMGGEYDPQALQSFNQVLRDHRTGEVTQMDQDLFNLLYDLQRSLGTDNRIEIISGYRSPKTNAMLAGKSSGVAKKSYHTRGMAIDIAIPGVELKDLRNAALELKRGGVGFYPRSGFVHVDTGRVRRW